MDNINVNTTIPYHICPVFNNPCKHVSMETTTRPYTKIEKDTRTGLFKPAGFGNTIVELGAFCNDAGKFVEQMYYCPVRWGNSRLKKYNLITKSKRTFK